MIGILAGMGPKSTGPFVDKVVEQCQKIYGAKYDIDFPHMMIYSCPTPFYIDRSIDHNEMKLAIIKGVQKLESIGVDFIAIPCNTAHIYFQEIQYSSSVPVLNMVEETIKQLPKHSKKVALLATEPTVQSEIYQKAMMNHKLDYIQKSSWQLYVNEIISKIKTGQINESIQLWHELQLDLSNSVDSVVVACTDINVIFNHNQYDLHFVDSSTCLAQAIVKKYLSISNS